MKKRLIYTILYIAITACLPSCSESFLDVIPLRNKVASTTADYDLLMNNVAFYRDEVWSPLGLVEAQLMGDEAAAVAASFNQGSQFMTRLFQWQDVIYQQTDLAPSFLTRNVNFMYTYNKVISEVMGSTEGTQQQKNELQGEAKARRAFANFYFINYYAKPYNAATAATDPGYPIVDQADVTVQVFRRGTVQGMYDFIIKDLTEAIDVLPLNPRFRVRFSKAAAEGLLGKVYLFMGRYSDALPLLNAAFSDLSASDVTLYDYNTTLAPGGAFLPIDPNYGPLGPGNDYNDFTEDVLSKIYSNDPQSRSVSNRGLVLSPQAAALFDSRDLRLKLYSANSPEGPAHVNGLLRKYGIRYSRYGLQLSELYLLRAECKARLNDLAGATSDLETLRTHRMPANAAAVPFAIANNQTALVKFVIDERIREFALEGYRWFDMRRLSVDPLFTGITFTHTLYNQDGTTVSYTLNQPNRLVMKIPPGLLNSNPGMTDNP